MANDAQIKREAARGKALLESYSQTFQEEWDARQKGRTLSGMFPSTREGGRQFVSPLGGEAPFPWGRKSQ